MTKDEFKKRWEKDEDGGGITFDDIAECAKKWGLFATPKIHDINEVLKAVLKAANVEDQTESRKDKMSALEEATNDLAYERYMERQFESRKENKKKMGQLVYILGRSGTGKSYSMRNFPKDKLAVINVQGKILPFKGAGSIEQTATDVSSNIEKALEIYAHDYKSIVIDDYQYVMANEFMRRSSEKGYDKFTEIGRHAWDIANKVRTLPADVIVYIMCHTDRDDDGNEKIKTIGKLLDEKICLEGMSTIVLKTNVSDGQYTFLTQNNGKDTVKSPEGMFPTYAIDNDLWYVDQKIRSYYEIGEHLTDEEMAAADQEVAKPEIKKEAEEPKQRRRKDRNVKDKEEKPEEASAEEAQEEATAETTDSERENRRNRRRTSGERNTDTSGEEVSTEGRRRRSAKTASEQPSEEMKEETPADGGRRRRRRKTEDWMDLPDGDTNPFGDD